MNGVVGEMIGGAGTVAGSGSVVVVGSVEWGSS